VRKLPAEIGILRPNAFDAEPPQALRRFQVRAGLFADGVAARERCRP
jgi:murein L,D-transpeptidase YcbB/YkuD